ncbi:MAG: hypothetical protein FWF82_02545 [Oscillospiraceae bacterium]|nr:hypothetical protein [Oscillospiraceae bacterium]
MKQKVGVTWKDLYQYTYRELSQFTYEQIRMLKSAPTEQFEKAVFYREVCGFDWKIVAAIVGYEKHYGTFRKRYEYHFNPQIKAKKSEYSKTYRKRKLAIQFNASG